MSAATPPPLPIFDNLDRLQNPFRLKSFPVAHLCVEGIEGADLDYEYAWKFLYSYTGSSATFNAYRREVERLLQWAWRIRGVSILALKREHIEEYVDFCQSPPAAWIGLKTVPRFVDRNGERQTNPAWRPFLITVPKTAHRRGIAPDRRNFTLSATAVQSIFAVLSSFYNFLIQEEQISANPVLLIRQKSKYLKKQQHKAPVRRISNLQWDVVIETAEKLAAEDPEVHERTLFVMNCLFGMYLRISELVADERSQPTMGDFRRDMDGNWWFHVIGKGNKSRIVTVSSAMLEALKRYRRSLGLSALPTSDDQTPLVQKQRGHGPVTSTRQVRTLVQRCFDLAYDRMVEDGLEEDAAELRSATVHWLRHTGISEDVKTRPREHVRDDAGHASMQTTDRYIESDLRERHASGRGKRLKEL